MAWEATGQPSGIVELIGATTTQAGLKVGCALDQTAYPAGIKVSDDAQMQTINLHRHEFYGDWNYTISPAASKQ